MEERQPPVATGPASPDDQATRQEATQRLLQSWRAEMGAKAVYDALAAREHDPHRADIIRQMGEAEGSHRRRIEQRLSELGVPLPDPASVQLSPWRRLQLRLAPTSRILAAQEAAEDSEVRDRYRRPTGDVATDRLLGELRQEERQHGQTVGELRSGVELQSSAERARADAASPTQVRLDRMLKREHWHQTGSGWISGAIYGANDGLAAVFGIVSGMSGATGGSSIVLTAGLAGAVASALSMATGAFLAERSEAEVATANLSRERNEIAEHPEEEREEISLMYQLKGLNKEEADTLAEKLSEQPDTMLRLLAAEELGGAQEGGGKPGQAALAAGVSTGLGAMVPVIPFFWLHGTAAVIVAAAVSLVAHFLVGAAKSLFTLRTWWAAGLEMTLAGIIVGGVTYAGGLLFHMT